VVARVLANPPPDLGEMLMICRLCWPLDRQAVLTIAMMRLANEIKARYQSGRRWLVRWRPN
jgi:hypothetical protein